MKTAIHTPEQRKQLFADASLVKDHLFDSIKDQVIITDRDGVILYANTAAEERTGFAWEEMIGKKPGELWGKQMDTSFYQKMWHTIKREKKSFVGVVKNIRKNGITYYAELRIYPVTLEDERGRALYFIGIEPDVSARVLEEKNTKEFFSILAHQVKSPIAAEEMLLNVLMKQDGHFTQEHRNILQQIQEAHAHLAELVRDLTALARIDTLHPAPLTNKLYALRPLLDEISKEVASAFVRNKELIRISSERVVTPAVAQTVLREIMQNIIANAARYSEGIVRVSVISKEHEAVIVCQDKGIGIPKSEQAHIFQPFFRASNAKEYKIGTGLGLYVAKKLADDSGCKIWFSSYPGKKTTFFVSIPLRQR